MRILKSKKQAIKQFCGKELAFPIMFKGMIFAGIVLFSADIQFRFPNVNTMGRMVMV
jgi:hypothetical protein